MPRLRGKAVAPHPGSHIAILSPNGEILVTSPLRKPYTKSRPPPALELRNARAHGLAWLLLCLALDVVARERKEAPLRLVWSIKIDPDADRQVSRKDTPDPMNITLSAFTGACDIGRHVQPFETIGFRPATNATLIGQRVKKVRQLAGFQ